MKEKICLFGGSFDPVHMGHLVIAETARLRFGFDRVIFVPAFQPPHKDNEPVASADERAAMVRIAISGNPFFDFSDFEIASRNVSYTHETVRHFKDAEGVHSGCLYFLLGLDMLGGLDRWKELDYLMENVNMVVGMRPGMSIEDAARGCAGIGDFHRTRIIENIFEVPAIDISSTIIKERIVRGESIKYLVPEGVERYIYGKKIYAQD